MNDYQKRMIMEQSRHQIIYSYDSEEKHEFLKSLETDYPIVTDKNRPMAIYMQDYALPQITSLPKEIDRSALIRISREHFNLSLIKNIIERITRLKNGTISEHNLDEYLKRISIEMRDRSTVASLEDYLRELDASLELYLEYFNDYVKGKSESPDFSQVKIPFILPEMSIPKIKKLLNNRSYFGVIIDKDEDISPLTVRAINNYVTMRINSDLSMKIACTPDGWPTYYDITGMLAEAIHDYGEVELDDSLKEYTKKMKNSTTLK